jgi:two-component system, chemotaxis family, protein-glutamate methylesterase/glutaminase
MPERVRVLVVDDSAYVRKVVSQMLARSPSIEVVGAARDGAEALELVEELKPDVITCDLNMPVMDGVAFVRAQMARRPVPIVIISIAAESGEQVLAALDAGAVDFVQKPTALATERLLDISDELTEKVKAAGGSKQRTIPPAPVERVVVPRRMERGAFDVVVIGISTGGPQGLKVLIPQLPPDFPVPIAMVMHMPVGYTEMYAKKLDEMSSLHVIEAGEGDVVETGTVYLAPAGRHLSFRRDGGVIVTHLDVRPLDTPHRPSVDALFHSAAEVYGARVLGVVMTGMGNDGREGSAWIKARGGCILTEAEDSCVVYGMPRSVVEAGLSDESVMLERMAQAIVEKV